jgi:hypothetical protein
MHFELKFLDIMFQLTIFGLFSYKILSLVRQYLIPYLYQQIKLERNTRLELIEKENLLISNQHKIETQISHQHTLLDLLEKNINTWQNHLLEQKQIKDEEFNNIKISIENKRAVQQDNYVIICTSKEVLPYAVSQAETALINKYAEQSGKISFDNLIVKLTKTNHKLRSDA